LHKLMQDRSKDRLVNGLENSRIVNALTIDVEDYFQVHALSCTVRRGHWSSFVPRVEKNTLRILDIIDSCSSGDGKVEGPRATFFVLGWTAERFPSLVREISTRGHEVACHGYWHECIFNQTRKEFEEDVRKAKGILEDITGKGIIGYRAPTYSIMKETLWAVEVLVSLGFRYDSSIFPIRHDAYGIPDAPRFPFFIDANGSGVSFRELDAALPCRGDGTNGGKRLLEFPLTTARFLGVNMPVAGGGYFRLVPYSLTRRLLRRVNHREKKPFIFYIHPWELDAYLPRIDGGNFVSNFRTYVNLDKTEEKLRNLLSSFCFSSVAQIMRDNLPL
jgi:polysaccharide deacetylase family protein (PEP-CTERM system associated)